MKFKRICIALAMIGLLITGTASAEVIGEAIMTGYTYMNGQGSVTTYPEDAKDYFVVSALEVFGADGDADLWGYAWVKFDVLATETVESAYLVIDLLGTGSMTGGNPPATTTDLPAYLDVYDPGDVDVEGLTVYGEDGYGSSEAAAQVEALKDALLDETPVSSLTMTASGTYSIDITELYNSWVLDPDSNNGIVLASGYVYDGWIPENVTNEWINSLTYEEYHAYVQEILDTAALSGSVYASFDRDGANAPYISTTVVTSAVPVPGAFCLLCFGLVGLAGLRRARNR